MFIARNVMWVLMAGIALGGDLAGAQNYPHKPIRIVSSEPGGGNDVLARLIAQGITASLGQPAIIDNRPARLMGEIVAKAPPDGYTLLLAGSALWLSPLMKDRVPYDVIRDFSPVTLVTTTPLLVTVPAALPVNSIGELIALAKAKPGALNYASGASGAASHLGPELFKAMAGVDIVRVPYKGSGPGLTALIAGEVQLMIANAGSGMPHVKSGKLKALAATSAKPSALLPGLPTVAASGLPGYEAESRIGMFAPAKTPAAVISVVNQEAVRVLNRPDVKQKLFDAGVETVGSSPAQLAATVKSEMARMDKVIKDAGIREE